MKVPGDRTSPLAPVMLLGMSATALGTLQLLGGAGIRCYGVDDHRRTPTYWSRYCRHGTCLPAGATDDDILKVLHEFAANEKVSPVLLPTSDRFVRLASSRRAELDANYQLLLPENELVEDLLDKQRFAECALRCGVTVPRSVMLSGFGELPGIAEEMGLPIIIKPACKDDRAITGIPKVIILEHEQQIAAAVDRYGAITGVPLLAQEYIPGGDTEQLSVAVCVDRNAEVIATFTGRKVRQGNLGSGVGTYVERFQDTEAEQIAADLLRRLKYVGVGEVEFKRHAKTKQLYLIEVNPRVWTQIKLPAACGLDFPLLFYCLATGRSLPTGRVTERSVAWQSLWDDFYNTFRGGGYRAAGLVSTPRWIKQSLQARVGAYFQLRDPLPGLAQLVDAAKQVMGKSG
jgi:predicted ATP-grasp superfamily ATP-dependent carboligase